jgi:hypothetical protein
MLGVSQPGNPPSSLRHSASFSCLQRGSGSEGHRARTSTLPQQPSLQLGMQQYGGLSSLQHRQAVARARESGHGPGAELGCLDPGNDYGFVRSRPRLRGPSGGCGPAHPRQPDEQELMSKSAYAPRPEPTADLERSRQDSKNPLRGALILFSASTSSWWKSRQREELGGPRVVATSPTQERRWTNGSAGPGGSSLGSPAKETKWPGAEQRKWSTAAAGPAATTAAATATASQDRRWRSLGALLRTPVGSSSTGCPAALDYCERGILADPCLEGGCYRRGTSGCKSGPSLGEGSFRPGRQQRLDGERERELEEEAQAQARRAQQQARGARSARAQSFYLLDDFLRPQPSSLGGSAGVGQPEARQLAGPAGLGPGPGVLSGVGAQRGVANVTPPRRHNSSSDSLEVATSPLPPPVPPPPPQISGSRDRDWGEALRDKDLYRCRMCCSGLQQRSLHEEVSFFFLFHLPLSSPGTGPALGAARLLVRPFSTRRPFVFQTEYAPPLPSLPAAFLCLS